MVRGPKCGQACLINEHQPARDQRRVSVPRLRVRGGGRAPLAAVTTAAVVTAMLGLGIWSFNDMRTFRLGSPAPVGCNIGQQHCPAGPPHGAKGRGPAIQAPGG
jgi:hypothetical protein